MSDIGSRAPRRRSGYAWLAAGPVAAAGAIAVLVAAQPAVAATAPVGLGTAGSFAVLAGQTVTNTGPSVINGNLGVSPGTAVTGFPPGTVNGVIHSADAVAAQAQLDLTTAYNDAAGRSPTANIPSMIGNGGPALVAGVYKASSTLEVQGRLTLNGGGDPNAVFIFQAPSSLTTDSASSMRLINGAQACNVFWQVGSSATLGTHSSFIGTVLALTSISVTTGDTIAGRVLARNGQVSLDTDTITAPTCAVAPPTPTPTPTTPTPTPTGTTPTPTPTGTTPTPTPTRTTPTPTPTRTTPTPTPTRTTPTPTPTGTTPTPTPTRTSPTPRPTGTSPTPTPTSTRPTPRPTGTSPTPKPTGTSPRPTPRPTSTSPVSSSPRPTSPSPTPTSTSPTPGPAPIPTPVGGTFPVTG